MAGSLVAIAVRAGHTSDKFLRTPATHSLMTSHKTIEINEKNIINFAASINISDVTINSALDVVEAEVKRVLTKSTFKLLAYTKIMFLLFFGKPNEIWSIILHTIIGVPVGSYVRGLNQPVLHCPKCGRPGKPNGTTKVGTHQYVCPQHKTFTEKTSAEYKLFRYILLLKARMLLKSGLSVRLISVLLGTPRAELSDNFSKIDISRIVENMKAFVIAAIKATLTKKKYALVVIDTTFVGGVAVIMLTVAGGATRIHIAEAEKKKYVATTIAFLKDLSEDEQKRLVFLSDGSIQIFKAIRQYFPHSIHIRQFHGKKHKGLVYIHFEYNRKRYTLVTRWDHLVPKDDRMHNVRGLLNGERLLREDEIILYSSNLTRFVEELSKEEVKRKIGECVWSADFILHLDTKLKEDYERYKKYGKGKFPSRVSAMLNTFRRTKTFLGDLEAMCRAVNAEVIEGFEKLLRLDLSSYDARYISHIYKAFKQVSLCKPTTLEKRRFNELKRKILEIFSTRLVEVGLLQIAENTGRRASTEARARKIFRGKPDELGGEAKEAYNHGIAVLEDFFTGKYITSNQIEGQFGRVKVFTRQHRNAVRSLKYIYTAFWRTPISFTNRVQMILELMEDYPLESVFCANRGEQSRGERSEFLGVEGEMTAQRYYNKVLEAGKRYRILYKNSKGEEKRHRIKVLKVYRRKKVMGKTRYIVRYLDTGEVRKLRGDRILEAEEIL